MDIRRFEVGDERALFAVYHSAVHRVAARDYSAEQVQAWAPADLDPELWQQRMQAIQPFVVQEADQLIGYADLQPSGYIDHFFVSGHHQRRGVGALLMSHLHEQAARLQLQALTADVSRTAEPFFMRYGFAVVERRQPVRRGVVIPNAFMRKVLSAH